MSYTNLSTTIRTSQKRRQCVWCGESIQKGSKYTTHVYMYDSDFMYDSMHNECNKASIKVGEIEGEFSFNLGDYSRGSTKPRWEE